MRRIIARWLDRHFLLVMIVVLVALFGGLLAWIVPQDIEWKEKCETAGGVNASSEHKYVCLQKSAVIEIK